ncbi:hypothetical protein CAI21_09870 [Alkalilimnicola ehrlichii]|uniref:diguanylate cyclase n=1 Tax=Alkalilimnicola ehrlichii TaxID=351052 RepID=A0A3E0WY98_9GAMM|nr:diguanylate cyclase [Alkalilimnicola ehrlichii]RFA29364.1 hypothetical protein CAI21_09870 [Alkalilimnicola ehrlichii]RFA36877.1 hypothetical protein CAL65_10200 [Alkalilimnicola ehrlichii]
MKRLTTLLLSMLISASAQAGVLSLAEGDDRLALDEYVFYLEDVDADLTFTEIRSSTAWQANESTFNAGYSASAWWFRLVLDNASERSLERWLELSAPLLDSVHVYVVEADKLVSRYRFGALQPFEERLLPHENFIVPLRWEPGQRLEVYLRVQAAKSLEAPMALYTPKAFAEYDYRRNAAKGLFLGAMLLIGLQNLLLFGSFRDRAYLFYVGFVISMALFLTTLTGWGFRFLWPAAPVWNEKAILLGICLVSGFGLAFIRNLFGPHVQSLLLTRIYRLAYGVTGFGMLVAVIAPYSLGLPFALLPAVMASVIGITVGILAWRRGVAIGKYFTLSWAPVFLGVFIVIGLKLGWLPANVVTRNALFAGVGLEMLLFSLALATRINAERRARLLAQRQVLETERKVKEELEERVAQRSRELDQLNEQLRILSTTDELTGLANRRILESRLAELWRDNKRKGRYLALIFADIDWFKAVNDTHGHAVGDAVLQGVADRIREVVEALGGLAARYGGEEFCILLPGYGLAVAAAAAERIRVSVGEAVYPAHGLKIGVTLSLGVAARVPDTRATYLSLLQQADQALYRAKAAGRDRVCTPDA